MEDVAPSTTRRGLLAGGGVAAVSSLAGCFDRLWSQAETPGPDQISMSIKAVPADDDPIAATIASRLRENYSDAGIDASHEPVAKAELYRDVLLEGEYDVFVARHPGYDDPDDLYGLLHSRFVGEQGWQNPFRFTELAADNHLETQREATEDDRPAELVELLDHLLQSVPFTAVAHPYRITGARESFEVPSPPRDALGYVELCAHAANGPRDGPLEVGVFGEGLTERLNPLAVDRNRIEGLLDLLYDPLARRIDGSYVPWLAESAEWDEGGGLRARITLREGLEWHDGEPIDADDVAFTFELIEDTSLGEVEGGIPAPRFRGQQTLVESTDVVDSRTIELYFVNTTRAVAARALTIPLFPEHIWAERSELLTDRQTVAVTDDNENPVGSGLFAFADASTDEEVVLEPFDAHALRGTSDRPSVLEGFSRFEGIRFQVAPNSGAMRDLLIDGDIDVTASEIPPGSVEEIRDASDVSTTMETTDAFYMVGFNSQHAELGNPNFRRVCARLIDRQHVVSEIFEGFATQAKGTPSLVGIHDDAWEYDDDEFADPDPDILSFPGTDGSVDTSQSQPLFQDIGYNYDGGQLLK
ncbi:ABC transporter substrate-binding protein [Natronorubrum texcoconense]|uniref:Peptide/nickel transport system substrate-binding protein n=1 Tax=Natronorubrum texcoconense TaxID=1095776 RepID=A0A1G8ZK45_9EURY|nr:ABC transporter substrate-binding protein [Natronorubrum texcoconense]SDK15398.1 peptide/nickel transport system substrate-binding protein [Natronorubrum texcoconense]